ncbi:MAG: alpha/beta hydrolase [Deltaproteobacteria bacterium]|jgi:3-oxoadipate enol-lactonase|nr:alpha/beta hydrolase [Deltaproteobacteria bacterium]
MSKVNLIFLHGFPFNSLMWMDQSIAFKSKYNVFTPDLRGHRYGPSDIGPWMIAHFADDIKLLIDQNGLEKVILCGLSMGGYIALHFAHKYPEYLSGLILCDTMSATDSNATKDKRYELILRIQKEGLLGFAQEFSMSVLSETTISEKPEVQKKVMNMITTNSSENIAMVAGALASRHDCTPYLTEITCPTLVLVGAEDKVTSVDVNLKLSKDIEHSNFKIIENAGHLSNIEQPEVFNKYIEEFIVF